MVKSSIVLARSRSSAAAALQSIIRVDHAGELGADRIYAGQMAVLGNTKSGRIINEMWQQEKHHRAKFEQLIVKHRVRPTALTPLWNVAGFMLGAGTALLGEKAAMACTVAVESVIVQHYNEQLRTLMADPKPDKELLDTIRQFRDEEQEHHDCGLDQGAEQAPMYSLLTEIIKQGCRAAISVSKSRATVPILISCRSYSSSTSPWRIMSAVCIERKPIITEELNEFEKTYESMLEEMELVNSYKSDHELRLEEDKRREELLKLSDNIDADVETTLQQTAQDFEDAGMEELNRVRLQLGARVSQRDADLTYHGRKLDHHLVLLTQYNYAGRREPVWSLPHDTVEPGETLRDTANRIVCSVLGGAFQAQILGNAPFGYYKFKYPKDLKTNDGALGGKLFIFKALYKSGNVELNQEIVSAYQWATRSEMRGLIKPAKYLKSIEAFLLDESDREQPALDKPAKRKMSNSS